MVQKNLDLEMQVRALYEAQLTGASEVAPGMEMIMDDEDDAILQEALRASLADFNGLDASGEWLLIVEDTFRQFSAGELGGWSLTVHTSASDTQPQATFAANTEVSVAAGETKTSSMNVDSSHAARTLAFTVHFSAESTDQGCSLASTYSD